MKPFDLWRRSNSKWKRSYQLRKLPAEPSGARGGNALGFQFCAEVGRRGATFDFE